jgi:non-ribosomal peptide synthetase component E (peptide arylation enzyme)
MYQKQLMAFINPESLDVSALRQTLAGQYDNFIVPDQIRALNVHPLTTNGKADNRAL